MNFKQKLPSLNPEDPEKKVSDLAGYFEHVMQTAEMHQIHGKYPLPLKRLRKMAYLASKPGDAQVLDTAFWTYCGHKVWPPTHTIEIIVQALLNLEQFEYVHDVSNIQYFLNHHLIMFHPSLRIVKKYMVKDMQQAMMELGEWEHLANAFKVLEQAGICQLDLHTFFVGIRACIETKDFEGANQLYERGKAKLGYTKEFRSAISALIHELPPEERELLDFGN